MSAVHISSEVGRLRKVLVHEPGAEVDHMIPAMMEDLLFDDLLFGETAREEHRRLARVLRFLGVEVLDAQTLFEESLEREAAREWLLEPLLEVTPAPVRERMLGADARTLAAILVHGVRPDPETPWIESGEFFEVPPIPNLCFQRDPQSVVGDGVLISSMATPARWREALVASTVFRFHPKLAHAPILVDPMANQSRRSVHLGPRRPHFEGGDVLVLSSDVVALGYSQRTNRSGVQYLARALSRLENGPRWLVVVKLPNERAFMHLDTVLTPIDRDACLVFPPILAGGGGEAAQTFEIDLRSEAKIPVQREDLLGVLRSHGVDYKPIPCGGPDPMRQQREQWTDGANALAVAPGVILLYDRNVGTAEELDREGFRIMDAEDLLLGGEDVDLDCGERVCILLPSHEISRARGGPHCLTHPLVREDAG